MKAKLSALTIAFFMVSTIFVSFAQTVDTVDIVESAETADTTTVTAEEPLTCEEITKNIDDKILKYKIDEPAHTVTYQMLYLKVDAATKKAKLLGYDTKKLELNLIELDLLIKDFEDNFNNFITKYELIKRYACDIKNDALHAQSFINTKRALGDVKNTSYDIYELYQNEIRQNILGLEMLENGK
ncbi:hypothetical protein ACFLZK_00425 [Patescibacteria group bacterium]